MENSSSSKYHNIKYDHILIWIYYLISIIISVISVILLPISNIYFRTLVADILSTLFIYLISLFYKNTSVYDLYWSVYPMFIVLYWLFHWYSVNSTISVKQILIVIVVYIWAIRLNYNWESNWKGLKHEDWRYSKYRTENPKLFIIINLFGLQLMPTLWVFLGSLSIFPALTPNRVFNFFDIIGIIIFVIAILFESIGDIQMHKFAKIKKEGEFINTGLWKYTRHPNYFGEISFWWSLYFFALGSDLLYWWVIIGPTAITALFFFVSIPMMEKRNLKKRPGYKEYQNQVSKLFPWFRKSQNIIKR